MNMNMIDSAAGGDFYAMPPDWSKYLCTVVVQFKYGRIAEYGAPFLVTPGDYVVVNGGSGQDFGRAIQRNTPTSEAYPPHTGTVGDVLKIGTADEAKYWHTTLCDHEADLTEKAQSQAMKLRLNLTIVGAECQWDSTKVTFFYESKFRVDFVTFLAVMYRKLHCRLWMEKVPQGMNLVSPVCKK